MYGRGCEEEEKDEEAVAARTPGRERAGGF